MVQYDVINERDWEQMPAPQAAKPPSEWEPVLDELEQGKIISLPFNDPKDRRSKYMAVARRAAGRGFKTQMRYADNTMAIRKSEEPYTRPPAKPRQPRQRRAAGWDPDSDRESNSSSSPGRRCPARPCAAVRECSRSWHQR